MKAMRMKRSGVVRARIRRGCGEFYGISGLRGESH
jgi:hypothetical protein